jgi:hypothetical protein
MEKKLNKKAFIDQAIDSINIARKMEEDKFMAAAYANPVMKDTVNIKTSSALMEDMVYAKKLVPNLWSNSGDWDNSVCPPPVNPYMSPYVEAPLKTKSPESIDVDDVNEEEFVMPADENDIDMIRKSFVIERVGEFMRISAIAIDVQNRKANDINMIKCHGEPLGCYAYNSTHDSYLINCVAWTDLGSIPVAYRAQMQGNHSAGNLVALPSDLIEKYLPPIQKKKLKSFREKYKEPQYSIQFMQAIGC